jgi:hypothetical protein
VTVADLRNHLSEHLDAVEKGEEPENEWNALRDDDALLE